MVTEFSLDSKNIVLKGWAFSPIYYDDSSVQCELILQAVETNEAIWVKMEKNPEEQEIAERYSAGQDYSKGSFEGKIKISKLDENQVYEILLRYTSNYEDKAGSKQEYVKTVSVDKFIYQGRLEEYNLKDFAAPQIAGTELEKELEGAKLFHYFLKGMWVYYDDEKLIYIIKKDLLSTEKNMYCPLHWYVNDIEKLPEPNQQYGFGNNDFFPNQIEQYSDDLNKYKVITIELPLNDITFIRTGIYDKKIGWIDCEEKQLR